VDGAESPGDRRTARALEKIYLTLDFTDPETGGSARIARIVTSVLEVEPGDAL
jgi:hypothetical protein